MAMTYGGMLYFPFKVSFMDEVPIELAEAKFGLKSTAAIMKLLCKIHKENGYYLKWDEEQCLLFTNKAGKDINEQEMQGIVDILVEKGFFDLKTYREQQVLTSIEIQKVWLEATKRRKRDLPSLPYMLVKAEGSEKDEKDNKSDTGNESGKDNENGKGNENANCTQEQGNCTQHADNSSENACNPQQSKESKANESRANESKALPPLTPPGENGGNLTGNSAIEIPGYAYNKQTHNLECLLLDMEQLHINNPDEQKTILRLSDYGRLGHPVWRIIHDTRWSVVNTKGKYLIAALAKEKRNIKGTN